GIPVMMAFRQFLPSIPEEAIAAGRIDFWEMCRPMISDPELPAKVREGRENEIIPCIACNLCFSRLYYHQPIMCSVRPSLGHEGDADFGYYGFQAANRQKKIVVVGGGPAGLQCAAVAAQRGHSVILYEQGSELGGNILLASRVDKGAIELLRPIRTLEAVCTNSGVDIRMGVAFSDKMFDHDNPDALIIASGGRVRATPFRNILTPAEIISGAKPVGKRVLIIGRRGAGLGVAVFLLNHGEHEITIIEEGTKIGRDVNPFYLWQYVALMKKSKATMLAQTRVTHVADNAALLSGISGDIEIPVDTAIMSLFDPAVQWTAGPKDGQDVYYIGDARRPRRLNNAIHDAFKLGMVI
ncbi:MAG TPA: FAD-dependent oxidoreductase, partial [Syntrophorhabdaceae bacterium]|nr:FAD-dependent oxidoreductase [Syntrophorhabdaceae bacterium]